MTDTFDSLLAGTSSSGLFEWRGDPERDLVSEAATVGWAAWPLDTVAVRSVQGFYDEVRSAWGLPPWFGDNLDALFDALGEMAVGPCLLVWDGSSALAETDPDLAAAVLAVLRDALGQAEKFSVILRSDPLISGIDGLR